MPTTNRQSNWDRKRKANRRAEVVGEFIAYFLMALAVAAIVALAILVFRWLFPGSFDV